VQQIVLAHGGTVGVTSVDPGGTTFELLLPKS
jgi:signal transduction histidine kinase